MLECQPAAAQKRHRLRTILLAAATCATTFTPMAFAGQLVTQQLALQPGWNAIFLEVQPDDPAINGFQRLDIAAVFDSLPAGLPLESAWTWYGRTSTVQFIEDPSEARLRETGWLGYLPTSPGGILSNLHTIEVNRAYLIKLGGSEPATWEVTGRPRFSRQRWVPGSFNLVGMPVAPLAPPTFAAFFAASAAHVGQPIHRLEADGTWRLADAGESMKSGEAFWIYTGGASDFAGPMHLEVAGDGLDFAAHRDSLEIGLTNRANFESTFHISMVPADSSIVYQSFDTEENRFVWLPVGAGTALGPIEPGQRLALRVAPIRSEISEELESILELSDGAGSRRRLPVRAVAVETGCDFGGLWVGTASIDQVSEIPSSDPVAATAPLTPTVSSVFNQRLLIHVGRAENDSVCKARLLDEIFQMWLEPGGGELGCFVLVSDRALLDNAEPGYSGSTLVDGEPVGRRISTVAYHLEEDAEKSYLEMAGSPAPESELSASIVISSDHPTHPYRHRYHPDHAAMDELTRELTLSFASQDPVNDQHGPDWQSTRLAGTWTETILGLHRLPLETAGSFILRRVTALDTLNPSSCE